RRRCVNYRRRRINVRRRRTPAVVPAVMLAPFLFVTLALPLAPTPWRIGEARNRHRARPDGAEAQGQDGAPASSRAQHGWLLSVHGVQLLRLAARPPGGPRCRSWNMASAVFFCSGVSLS